MRCLKWVALVVLCLLPFYPVAQPVFETQRTLMHRFWDRTTDVLMLTQWSGPSAQDVMETEVTIFNRVTDCSEEDPTVCWLRVSEEIQGLELPATCQVLPRRELFVNLETGARCNCNDTGDGWTCASSQAEVGSITGAQLEDVATLTPGVCGDGETICQIETDQKGRVIDQTEIAIALPTGSVGAPALASTTVTPAGYGSTTQIPSFTVDADGRLTAAANNAIALGTGAVGAPEIASTTVAAASYGSTTQIPSFTVDGDGRLTTAANNNIVLGTGVIGATELAATAVGLGSYGTGLLIPSFTVDADGRLTAASTNVIDSSYVRTSCVDHAGSVNNSASGSGAFVPHTGLTCSIPAGKFTTGSVAEVCVVWQTVGGSSPPNFTWRSMIGAVQIAQQSSSLAHAVSTTRTWTLCTTTVGTEVPDAIASTQNGLITTAAAIGSGSTTGSFVGQPVDIDTTAVMDFTVESRWSAAGTGTNTATPLSMTLRVSGLLP